MKLHPSHNIFYFFIISNLFLIMGLEKFIQKKIEHESESKSVQKHSQLPKKRKLNNIDIMSDKIKELKAKIEQLKEENDDLSSENAQMSTEICNCILYLEDRNLTDDFERIFCFTHKYTDTQLMNQIRDIGFPLCFQEEDIIEPKK